MNGKNIVLIIFDTLRADLVYNEDSIADTPNIDSLLEKGVKFESAYSTAPETASSHGSMFTGLYPHNHGVACDTPQPSLREDVPIISAWLSERGYHTFAIAGPSKMGSDYGYDRGFDRFYENYKDTDGYETDSRNTNLLSSEGIKEFLTSSRYRDRTIEAIKHGYDDGARAKLDEFKNTLSNNLNTPYFVVANFKECHSSYQAPRPYMENKDSNYSRPRYFISEWIQRKLGQKPVSHEHPDTRLNRLTDYRESINQYYADSDYLNKAELETWQKWYAAELEYLDQKLGDIMGFLQKEEVDSDDTIFIFTADHGELFGEHDLVYHNNFLWDKLLHVPLIISGHDEIIEYKDNMVSLTDLFPTICDLVGIQKPNEIDGQSILSGPSRNYAFAEIGQRDVSVINRDWYITEEVKHRLDRGKKAVWDEDFKYIRYSDGKESVYTMPKECEINRVPESKTDKYKKRLKEELGTSFPTPPTEGQDISDSTLQNLKELGYR